MKKIIAFVALASLAALSPAPFIDPDRKGGPTPEMSQDQLAQQQALQKSQGEIGNVPADTDGPASATAQSSDEAAQVLSNAPTKNTIVNDPKAGAVIQTAEEQRKKARTSGVRMAFWALLFGAFGFGAIFAFRRWANTNIPEMPETKKITW